MFLKSFLDVGLVQRNVAKEPSGETGKIYGFRWFRISNQFWSTEQSKLIYRDIDCNNQDRLIYINIWQYLMIYDDDGLKYGDIFIILPFSQPFDTVPFPPACRVSKCIPSPPPPSMWTSTMERRWRRWSGRWRSARGSRWRSSGWCCVASCWRRQLGMLGQVWR